MMDISWLSQIPSWFSTLPVSAQQLLIGVATHGAGKLLDAAGYKVKKKFRLPPQYEALKMALAEALYITADNISQSDDELEHYIKLFGDWIEREKVAGEFSQIIDPHPQTEIDIRTLREEFENAGYDAEIISTQLTFSDIITIFVRAFYNAAATKPALQHQIEISLLHSIADNIERSTQEGIRTRQSVDRLADHLTPKISDQNHRYLQRIVSQCGTLPLRGMDLATADATTEANERVGLADVYVALDTTSSHRPDNSGGKGKNHRLTRSEPTQPLSALEALATSLHVILLGNPGTGKSTFINHLALCLANHQRNLADGWLDKLSDWPSTKAELLPIPVVLREMAAWVLATQSKDTRSGLLLAYLRSWLFKLALDDFYPALYDALCTGQALILLDGLDEVPVNDDLLKKITEMIEDLALAFPPVHILVTCRVLSYRQDRRWQLDVATWKVFELATLDNQKIQKFIKIWYSQLEAMHVVSSAEVSSGKLIQAVNRKDLRRFANNPLLLTVMALVHTHKGELPSARALLYEDVIDLLLWRWESVKLESDDRQETNWRQQLEEILLMDIDLKISLWSLAYDVHNDVSSTTVDEATADISEGTILRRLAKLHPDGSLDWADQMIQIMKIRAGLLVENRPGIYQFPHRTFEEYLAGCHLSNLPNFIEQSIVLAKQGAFWREVILLAVGRLVHLIGDIDRPLLLVNELCPETILNNEVSWRNAWLAGECLLEISLARAERLNLGMTLLMRVRERLEELITQSRLLSPRERAQAGSVLGEMGDPRYLDEMVLIPSGTFMMGSPKEKVAKIVEEVIDAYRKMGIDEDTMRQVYFQETPQHEVYLSAFHISKYPVTNEQYARFVRETGHKAPQHWDDKTPLLELRNHPVVNVNWYDASAYCLWLSKKRNEKIRLPTEAEWEKAARGIDGRMYPWGEKFSSEYCNMAETGVGTTSPVGIFVHDASPYGCLDMAGNTWEWCSTAFAEYPYNSEDGREVMDGPSTRILRGGSFRNSREDVRCVDRDWFEPQNLDSYIGFRVVSSVKE